VVPTNGILESEIDEIKGNDPLNVDREAITADSVVTDVTTVPSVEQTSDRPEDAIATTTARIEIHEFNPNLVTIVPTERIIDIANGTSAERTAPRRRKVLLRRRPVSSSTVANADQVEEEERPRTKARKRKVIRRKRPLQDSWSSTAAENSLEKEAREDSELARKSTTFEVENRNDIEESTVSQIGITSANKDDSESIATTNYYDHEVMDKVEDFTLAFTDTISSDSDFDANVTPETAISPMSTTFRDDEEATDSFDNAVTTATRTNADANEEYRSTEIGRLEATEATASTLVRTAIDRTESYTEFLPETSMPSSTDLQDDSAIRISTISTSDPDSASSPMRTIATSFTTEENSIESEHTRRNLALSGKSPQVANLTTSRYSLVSPTSMERNNSEILPTRRGNNFLVRRYPVHSVGSIGDDPVSGREEEDAREETENATHDLAIGRNVTEETTARNKAVLTNGLSDDSAEFWKRYTTVSSTARIKYPSNRAEDTAEDRGSSKAQGTTRDDVSGSTTVPTDRSEIRPRYRIPVIAKRPFDPEEALSPRRYPLDSALEESEETTETRSARIGQSALRQPRTRYKLLRGRDDIRINKDAAPSNRPEPAANTAWQYSRTRSYSRRPSLSSTEAAITETLIPARKFDYVADAFHRKQQSLRTTTTTTTARTISRINDLSDSQNLIDSDYTSTTTAKPLVTRLVTSIVESGTTERQKILIKTKYSSLTSTIRIPVDQFSSTSPPSFPVTVDDDNGDDEFVNEIREGIERSTLPIEGAFSQRYNNRLTTESQESSTIEIESVFNNLIAGKSSAKQ